MRALASGFAVTFAFALALLVPGLAQACSCAPAGSAKEEARAALDRADAVFIGVLESKQIADDPIDFNYFTYRVRADYGADLETRVRVNAGQSASSCAIGGTIGRKYAIALGGRPGKWSAGACSFLSPRAVRQVAGRGAKLAPGASKSPESGCSPA